MELGNLPIIDWDQANKLVGNKPGLAQEMLDLFIKTLPSDASGIFQAYRAKNFPEMLRQVHKLHGALCYCGLPRLKTVVTRLETELKNNIMDSLPSLLEILDVEVNSLLERYTKQNS